MGFLAPFEGRLYAVMRIVVGFLFLAHGVQKAHGILAGAESPMPEAMLWLACGIELVGGALVMVGLFGGIAAFLCSGTMAAAYFIAHHSLEALHPIQNRGELAALYAWVFLYIAARGSGVWSLDAARGARPGG